MFKCVKTFAGNKVSMKKGDTIENLDKELAEDYKRAGFIVEVIEEKAKEKAKEVETKVETAVKEVVKKVETPVKKAASKKKK